jgi:hypothetical protein
MHQNPSGWEGLFENLPFARHCLPRWPLPSIAEELLAFGKQMHRLVYPLTYGPDGRPSVLA